MLDPGFDCKKAEVLTTACYSPSKTARMAYGTFKILHALHMGYYWVPTGSNGSNDPFESSVLGVIDNPAAVLVFIHLVDLGIELRLAIQAIPFPAVSYTHLTLPTKA